MSRNYNHQKDDLKIQRQWQKSKIFQVSSNTNLPKKYILDMFSYPSGDGLHLGHPLSYTATDILSRYFRAKGYNVLHPVGWDAFGLPAENYAIKVGVSPWETTQQNIKRFTNQLNSFGFSYDWSREINTSDPNYYRWTQWLFLKLYEQGLAYRAAAPVNWCPSCQTVLANEQVVDGKCERCSNVVEQKNLTQWFFKITHYADELLNDLEKLNWPEPLKAAQRNWIGRSEGAEVDFALVNDPQTKITVFTTRLDTIYGATYMVLAPEHPLLEKIVTQEHQAQVKKYQQEVKLKSELQRREDQTKTGVFTGAYAINPASKEQIPIWIADYVLMNYGTGAVMAVPAHDERDWEFAKKYNLLIKNVIIPKDINCVVVHGVPLRKKDEMERTYDKHWIPWIKEQLQQRNIPTFTPLMPEPWEPNYEAWKKEFKKIFVNEKSILIGHSGGAAFLVRWLGETGQCVQKLILVAPWKVVDHKDIESWRSFFGFDVDSTIKSRVGEIIIFTSDNEEEDGKESASIYHRSLGGKLIEIKGRGHYMYGKTMSSVEFPELLTEVLDLSGVYINEGVLINSQQFNGLSSVEARDKIAKKLNAKQVVRYRLRDWLVSRQRYWGAPIPIIHCPKCGVVPVSEDQLPVELPNDVDFRPTGESPLARSKKFHQGVKCPKCKGEARRETDTLDTFVCSSWYWLRYCDPQNNKQPFSKEAIKQWLPVDVYVGGSEHAVGHLLFSRFITKALADHPQVKLSIREPFTELHNQGLLLGENGEKMSKSRGNVINPDDVIKQFGADAVRMYLMFMGPFEDAKPWSTNGLVGTKRFLERILVLFTTQLKQGDKPRVNLSRLIHATIKKVEEDIMSFNFNTAVSTLMIFFNNEDWRSKLNAAGQWEGDGWDNEAAKKFLILLHPFAPHLAEYLWQAMGHKQSIQLQPWPTFDPKLVVDDQVTMAVQVNGKLRSSFTTSRDSKEEDLKAQALSLDSVKRHVDVKNIIKVVVVPGKIINIVIKK